MRVFYPIGRCNAKISRRRPSGMEGGALAGPSEGVQHVDWER